jgi:hypothetical protein
MRAAEAILNGNQVISTAEGEKNPGELADFIEAETRIVELIDASRRLLQCFDDNPEALETDETFTGTGPSPEQRLEQLRAALRLVLDGQDQGGRPQGH